MTENQLGRRVIHLSANVNGLLANQVFDCLEDDDGKPLTRFEAEVQLRKLSIQGVKLIPCSSECVGFSNETGCPGHPVDGEAKS